MGECNSPIELGLQMLLQLINCCQFQHLAGINTIGEARALRHADGPTKFGGEAIDIQGLDGRLNQSAALH